MAVAVGAAHGGAQPWLTSYDAAYLWLAESRGLPLATLDAALRTACTAAGVETLPG